MHVMKRDTAATTLDTHGAATAYSWLRYSVSSGNTRKNDSPGPRGTPYITSRTGDGTV